MLLQSAGSVHINFPLAVPQCQRKWESGKSRFFLEVSIYRIRSIDHGLRALKQSSLSN